MLVFRTTLGFAFLVIKCVYVARTFLGITACATGNFLESCVKGVDSSLAEYHLPLYYEVLHAVMMVQASVAFLCNA